MQQHTQRSSTRLWVHRLVPFAALLLSTAASAQISLSTAVNLALTNDNRVKLAQADVAKAKAVLAQTKDAFVPAIAANGGVGKSTGAPLSPPVVFNIAAQSLVYNAAQGNYIRAAHASIEAAQLSLDAARTDVAEDVVNTYVTLDNALARQSVQAEALSFSSQLVRITEDRFSAGVDPHLELTKSRRTEAQIRLQQLLVEDEIATQTEHLAQLTGLSARGLHTEPGSVPAFQSLGPAAAADALSPADHLGTSAAFSAARAKQLTAHGETRYLLRPQIAFSANYARMETAFTNYEQYYPRFGANNNSFNSLSVGVQITLPILDMVHRAKAREDAAEAAHSLYEAKVQQTLFLEGRSKLRRNALELAARRDLASLEHDLARDQLEGVTIRLQATAANLGGEPLTPKDEANARLGERQRTVDMLSASLQLAQAQVMLMRQDGSLSSWLATSLPLEATPSTRIEAGAASSSPTAAKPALPATVGAEPAAGAPGNATPGGTLGNSSPGTAPSPAPTTGTPPASMPSSPVTSPTTPPGGVPAAPPSP